MPLLILRSSWCKTPRIVATSANAPRRWKSTRDSKPLNILFCGSDEFSCASLRAVHKEKQRNPESIASINVMCRPGKLSGRGMKTIREVPIKRVAEELGLQVHEQDTFTGWNLPRPDINLIIAVSFGLFVPPRILNSAEYGGVNIHPSLLPDFRGPAPLHHVLLAGESHTGVTLQTLHPQKFDHGAILAQTPLPGFEIPNPSTCTVPELLEFITPKAADLLVQGLRDKIFIPPIKDLTPISSQQLRHAPKITTEDRLIHWDTMTASEICRRDRVLGRLWSLYQPEERKGKGRVIFHGMEVVKTPQKLIDWQNGTAGSKDEVLGLPTIGVGSKDHLRPLPFVKEDDHIIILTTGKDALLVRHITKEGENRKPATDALAGMEITSPLEMGSANGLFPITKADKS